GQPVCVATAGVDVRGAGRVTVLVEHNITSRCIEPRALDTHAADQLQAPERGARHHVRRRDFLIDDPVVELTVLEMTLAYERVTVPVECVADRIGRNPWDAEVGIVS